MTPWKKVIYISISCVGFGLLFFAGRLPYVSDSLKNIAIPELEKMTGCKVTISEIHVNFLPLFIELNNTAVSDPNGIKLAAIGRFKAYLSLTGLLNKEIIIKRLALNDATIQADREQIETISNNFRQYLAIERKDSYKVSIRSALLSKGSFDWRSGDKSIKIDTKYIEALFASNPSFKFIVRDAVVSAKNMPELIFSAESALIIKDDYITVNSIKLDVDGSKIAAMGAIVPDLSRGELRTDADLMLHSVKKIFGLKNNGDGAISAAGIIRIDKGNELKGILLDLKIKGDLYLETLMELLRVKEKLEGHVFLEGELKGPLNDLKGSAKAVLQNGNLFGVVIDRVSCAVYYSDRKMKFRDGRASLYGGSAAAEAMITLPIVNYYAFSVDARDISSKGVFELIRWDPGIGNGSVNGHVESQGSDLRLRGNFSYKKNPGGKDIIERVQVINGAFSMDNNVISFQKLLVSSGPSLLSATGSVDLNRNTLSFSANGASSDMYDLSNPYFRALNGQINFTSNLSGPINDPSLDLKFSSTDIRFLAGNMNIPDILKSHTMLFDSVQGNLNYKKNILVLNNFKAVSGPMIIQLKGKIMFPQSKQLFDIRAPRYDLQASFDNGSLGDLSEIIRGSPSLKGTFHSAFTINGPGEKARASGYFRASNIISKDGYSIDRADAQLTFEAGEFSFRSLSLKKGQGSINAKGMITLDKRYSVNATVNNLDMYDIVPSEWRETMKARTVKTLSLSELTIQGKGNLSDPQLDLTGSLRYRDPEREQSSGYGKVKAEIKGKNVSLTGNFMQGKITISGHASLQGKIPWRANIDFQSARSDFFVALLMKDIPEDLLVNLKGEVRLWGERDSLNAAIMFDKAYLYGYGYGFTNSAPISVKLTDKLLSIDSFNMKNELSELRVGGSIDLGKQYNLTVRGGSSLAPLRAMFKNVDFLKGDASFSLELAGSWEKPRINGRMDVVNGTLGVKNIPHRLSGMNVRIVADGEKIVIEDARGTVSGGDVIMSGSAHLDHLKLRRFFLDINLSNVTISVSKNFWIHFDGKLSYQGNLQNQNITGDIGITKARYTERIDWKSWLLQARKKEALKFDLERLNQTALNVRIRGANLSIDNNLARATAKMDVLIKGTLGNPGLLGRMETTNGIVYFRNNEFNLIKGAIDFARPDEVKPYFNVLAETRIKNYNVRMALDGYLDQFNLALSSTPALEESDIISLLAVGDVSRNLKGMQGGIGAGEATSFLTGKLQDVIEDRLKTVTGVDRLQIDPSVSRTTGTVSPRVTISKRLLADKLYATYSTSADVAEGQIIKLEYLLNKNTSLVGIRDEKGGLGTDIKFRFQFK